MTLPKQSGKKAGKTLLVMRDFHGISNRSQNGQDKNFIAIKNQRKYFKEETKFFRRKVQISISICS